MSRHNDPSCCHLCSLVWHVEPHAHRHTDTHMHTQSWSAEWIHRLNIFWRRSGEYTQTLTSFYSHKVEIKCSVLIRRGKNPISVIISHCGFICFLLKVNFFSGGGAGHLCITWRLKSIKKSIVFNWNPLWFYCIHLLIYLQISIWIIHHRASLHVTFQQIVLSLVTCVRPTSLPSFRDHQKLSALPPWVLSRRVSSEYVSEASGESLV